MAKRKAPSGLEDRPREPEGPEPVVSVIIAARDAEATLARTLSALEGQRVDVPFEVLVVDDGSRDGTAALAENHPLGPRVLRRAGGHGAGAARNEGAAAARGSVFAFTDADCEPAPSWLAEGLLALSEADLVQGAVRPPPGVEVGPYDRTLWVTSEYGLYETANLFVRREWFERLNGFSDFVPSRGTTLASRRPFGEDAWFGWSARRLGARTAFGSDANVYHEVFPGSARDYIAEAWRVRHFPQLVSRIPELRDVFAWHRWFLNGRTAAFDAALGGAVAAIVLKSFLPLVGAAPYALVLRREIHRWGTRRKNIVPLACVMAGRDAVGFLGLVAGSFRARSPLL
jgi:glycosyltransferase involved in cell wall biosynthesis